MGETGIEPVLREEADFKSAASASSATRPWPRCLLRLGANYGPTGAWKVRFSAAGWVRPDNTYQTRNADNDWLEETRLDGGLNLDLSGGVALGQVVLPLGRGPFRRGAWQSGLRAEGGGSGARPRR